MLYYIILHCVCRGVRVGGRVVCSFMYVYTHAHTHIGAAKMIGLLKPVGVEAHFIIGKLF